MADGVLAEGHRPHLRWRLVAALILVAVGTGAVLVTTTYVLVRHYRTSTFRERSEHEVRLALFAAPERLDQADYEDLLLEFQERGSVDGLVVVDASGRVFSSFLDAEELPASVTRPSDGELVTAEARIGGVPYVLVAGDQAGAHYVFAFTTADLEDSIRQTRDLLLAGWVLAVLVAAASGRRLANRTLSPVREAAEAAQALADGLLDTRLGPSSSDEFEDLAGSFNRMADALEGKIAQLSEAAERERRFTANVAHELRTPLVTLSTASALIEPLIPDAPDEMRRPLQLLVEDVGRLRRLVDELLELARHDAGHETVDLEELRVQDAVDAVVAGVGRTSDVRVEVPADLVVQADRRRFGRVLGNLVTNAVDHGGADVAVQAREAGPWVVIDVLDRGDGLTGVEPDQLFDRFYKGDQSRTTGGSGLGLAIARENARLQGGEVSAAPRPGGGARFTLRLPAVVAGAEPPGGP